MAIAVLESTHRRDSIWSTADNLGDVLPNVSEPAAAGTLRHARDPNYLRVGPSDCPRLLRAPEPRHELAESRPERRFAIGGWLVPMTGSLR